MPTYVYQCKQCGKREEIFQRMTDSPAMSCSSCGGDLERRVSGGTGFIMKGSSLAEGQTLPRCGASSPCCGREERCDKSPCG
jgi:putative FmdB family regulatory protein